MSVSRKLIIQNHAGIHCRPSAAIISAAKKYPEVKLNLKGVRGDIELNSILSLLTLALQEGDSVTLTAQGKNETDALKEIGDLFEFHFDFPPQS